MDSFPDEIIWLILSRLPTLDLVRLQYVCRRWKTITKEPAFLPLHLYHSIKVNQMDNQFLLVQHQDGQKLLFQNLTDKTRYVQTSLAGHTTVRDNMSRRIKSDNGLLFFCDNALESIFIMNPFTNQSMLLPKPVCISSQSDLRACSFVFDPRAGFFKAVIIIRELPQDDDWRYNHYRLMLSDNWSTEWRSIGVIKFVWDSAMQVLVQGRLHWMAHRRIVSFDLASEKLDFIAPPDPLIPCFELDDPSYCSTPSCCTLMVIGGCLSVVYHTRRNMETLYLWIWIMREYGAEKSWVGELDMECILPSELRETKITAEVIGEIENGKILLRVNADWEKGAFAYLCELKSKAYEFIGQKEMPLLSDYWGERIRSGIHNANICWVTPQPCSF